MKIGQLLEYQKARETKAFRSWFGNSKVVDSNGNPLVVYRGTRKRPTATEFKLTQGRAVPSFTNDPAAASVYARHLDTRQYGSGSTVIAAYLRIVKPLDLTRYNETISLIDFINTVPSDLNVPDGGRKKLGWRDVSYMIYDLDEIIYKTGARFEINAYDDDGFRIKGFRDLSDQIDTWGEADDISSIEDALDNTVIDTYTIADSEDIVSYLQGMGYDGVILKDVFEAGAQKYEPRDGKELELGAEGTPIILTYRPFEQYQIKSIYNVGTFGRDEPDITKEEKVDVIDVDFDTPRPAKKKPKPKPKSATNIDIKSEENFKNWFKNSKIVDASGKPLRVYHGTDRDFSVFQKGRQLKRYPKFNTAQKHLGHFFTDDPSYAERYAGRGFDKDDAVIMPVYLSIQNPKIEPLSLIDEIENKWPMSKAIQYKKQLQGEGYDGIIFQGRAKIGDIREIVAFDNTQIKSVFNTGEFNPTNPNINKESMSFLKELEEGREENLRAWFGNSKVVDSNGAPMIVYHGTSNDFSTFKNLYRDFGIHFGNREAANEFAKYSGARVIPVYLKITNPFTMPDIFGPDEEHLRQVMNFLFKKKIINQKEYNELDAIRRDRDMDWDDCKATIYAELARSLFDAGYDGIQYRNTNEGKRTLRPDERINFTIKKEGSKYVAYLPDNVMPTLPIGEGDTPEEAEQEAHQYLQKQADYIDMSYIIFNSSQVKSAFGTEYDPKDPRYTKEDKRNPKYLSGTDKVANISPVLGAKPKKQKALMNKFFGSS
jgi:hypothetical protein